MLITHRMPREDRNAPAPKTKRVSAQKLLRQLHLALGRGPIRTAPKQLR